MKKHQKFLSLRDPVTQQIAGFAGAANIPSSSTLAGNQKVLKARLKDAKFFWQQDLKLQLDGLQQIGAEKDLSERIGKIAQVLADEFRVPSDWAYQAGIQCKADLNSQTVQEFPELQGIVGSLLLQEQESEDSERQQAMALAIRNQYQLRMPTSLAMTLFVAGKTEQMYRLFDQGKKPTGSSDPNGLRRAAIGILRCLYPAERFLSLNWLFALAGDNPETVQDLVQFTLARMKTKILDKGLRKQSLRPDIVNAAFLAGKDDNPGRICLRIQDLQNLLVHQQDPKELFAKILTAWKRCSNLLKAERNLDPDPMWSVSDSTEPERKLDHAIWRAKSRPRTVAELLPVAQASQNLFDNIRIHDSDLAIRRNRLALVSHARDLFEEFADLSQIQEST